MFNNNLKVWENGELITAEKLNSLEKKASPFYITVSYGEGEWDEDHEIYLYPIDKTVEEIVEAIEGGREMKAIYDGTVFNMDIFYYDNFDEELRFSGIYNGCQNYIEISHVTGYDGLQATITDYFAPEERQALVFIYDNTNNTVSFRGGFDEIDSRINSPYAYKVILERTTSQTLIGQLIRIIYKPGLVIPDRYVFLFKEDNAERLVEIHYYITIDSSNNVTIETSEFGAKES